MSDIAIKVENLGKSYLVGHNAAQSERYTALRDVIAHNAKNLARKTRDMLAGRPIVQGDEVEEFLALKDVSFEIKQGDRVGIIGRNGAGKSTLLKILSRITEPTTGRIQINGRVASLLEVGTGFHPELTGRENIFLNGAILGMSRREIQRKFDEIVDFAEVEKFLDTPVKRYSSGMYVRLAFAVAAHLEPEILIVDEVLAVGDAQFQKKCLGKMDSVASQGRTVLFVSHNMAAIRALCSRSLLLQGGRLNQDGSTEAVSLSYIDTLRSSVSVAIADRSDRSGDGSMKITDLRIGLLRDPKADFWVCGEDVFVDISYQTMGSPTAKNLELAITVRKTDDTPFLYCGTKVTQQDVMVVANTGKSRCIIPKLPVEPGRYLLSAEIKHNHNIADHIRGALEVEVHDGDFYGTGVYWPYGGFLCNYKWEHLDATLN